MKTTARFDPHTGVDVDARDPMAASASVSMGLEPPRFCTDCGRALVVQIVPDGWTARCSRHGTLDSYGEGSR